MGIIHEAHTVDFKFTFIPVQLTNPSFSQAKIYIFLQ